MKATKEFRHIKIVREGGAEYDTQTPIENSTTAAAFFQTKIGSEAQECFAVLFLDARHKPLGWRIVSMGTVSATIVHPREVFVGAIHLMASAIIVSHNHPSGDTSPSSEDLQITRKLKAAGEIIGINVLDHIIVSDSEFLSFQKKGIL